MTQIKVCGLCRPEDAASAVDAGASHVGIILSEDGPRVLDERRARLVLGERGAARAVGVFVDEPAERIVSLARALDLDVLQLHGRETIADARALRSRTGAAVWKAVRVRDAGTARDTIAGWAGHADGILLDGWSARAAGGTGARFDWSALRDVRAVVPEDVLLIVAGGLNADNVGAAVDALAPDMVDVSSGVEERPGVKSPEQIRAFVAAARATWRGASR